MSEPRIGRDNDPRAQLTDEDSQPREELIPAQRTDSNLAERTRYRWFVEGWNYREGWALCSSPSSSVEEAERKRQGLARRHRGMPTRITRETTTWTVETTAAGEG